MKEAFGMLRNYQNSRYILKLVYWLMIADYYQM